MLAHDYHQLKNALSEQSNKGNIYQVDISTWG